MSEHTPRPMTYDDLLRLPEFARAEVLGGILETSPTPLPKHSKAQRSLGRFVGGPFDDDEGYGGPGGWWIFSDVDIQLGPHDIVRPDVAGWRRKRLNQPGEQQPITVVPDWICEVSSPTTAARDRIEKRDLYGRYGVPHYWIVDPDTKMLEVFERQDQRWVLLGTYGEGATASARPFREIEIDVGRLFLPYEDDPLAH